MNIESAISDWEKLLGAKQVVSSEFAQMEYGSDTNGLKRRIPAALKILDGNLLPETMRAWQCAIRSAVYPISTGHNWGYGAFAAGTR